MSVADSRKHWGKVYILESLKDLESLRDLAVTARNRVATGPVAGNCREGKPAGTSTTMNHAKQRPQC